MRVFTSSDVPAIAESMSRIPGLDTFYTDFSIGGSETPESIFESGLHEIAHAIALGWTDIPHRLQDDVVGLSNMVGRAIEKLGQFDADQQEIQTLAIEAEILTQMRVRDLNLNDILDDGCRKARTYTLKGARGAVAAHRRSKKCAEQVRSTYTILEHILSTRTESAENPGVDTVEA